MHTIVLATQKGGSGKSTLAIGLALAAQQAGHNVRLIETDKQGTLSKWQCRRGLAELWGYVLLENRPMLELCRELGFTQRLMPDEPGTAQITLKL